VEAYWKVITRVPAKEVAAHATFSPMALVAWILIFSVTG